jgi:hypothetical protein
MDILLLLCLGTGLAKMWRKRKQTPKIENNQKTQKGKLYEEQMDNDSGGCSGPPWLQRNCSSRPNTNLGR